jgi:glutamine---fructose-6-phosphate transaminase (isomerizing)
VCGIVGYVGPKSTQDVLLGGLRRLEYRGYDSAGISVISNGALSTRKKAGKLENLVADIKAHPIADSRIGIGHTRWATQPASLHLFTTALLRTSLS